MIAFDLQAIQSVAHGERGIARFVHDLAAAVVALDRELVDVFLWNDSLPYVDRLDDLGLGDRLRPFSDLRGESVDLLHLNSPFEGLRVGQFMPPVRAHRVVATCYDLIPYRFPRQYLGNALARARYRNRLALLTVADALVTDSRSAADDAAELLGIHPGRLTVIGAGVGPRFQPPSTPLAERSDLLRREIPGLLPRFVLVPTGMDWRKNTLAAIEAYADLPDEVRDRHQLVLSCRLDEHHRAEIDAHCERLGVAGRVLVTGFVSDDLLVALYQTAELVFFASVYEGFGLPVLEARRCGARVICANTSSLPEVLPHEAAWFNPYDIADMAGVLERALCDMEFIAGLDAVPDPGFGWPEAARRVEHVYRSLLSEAGAVRLPASGGRRHLAVVSPLPPDRNGVANHSHRLLTAIHGAIDDVDVTAFVPWGASGLAADVAYPVRDLATLPAAWAAGEVDRVLYCVGNHEVHRQVLPMLELVPGDLFVHDARLLGAIAPSWWYRLLEAGEVVEGSRCLQPFVQRAKSVIVQSRFAADLVASETGERPVDIGPHHVPVVAAGDVGPDGAEAGDAGQGSGFDSAGPPWVITAGVADATKLTDVFVAVADRLVAAGDVRAAVVGRLGERFVGGTGVTATGHVTDPQLSEWFGRASVVVALRDDANGESSGIVADALAHGCPVVVSDVGAMAELPDDVVLKVDPRASAAELEATISGLVADGERRLALSAAARRYAVDHTPLHQARRLVAAVVDG